MEEASRTVRVSGLPADIAEERLIDKLTVYFLRPRNGGGEIVSVTVDGTKPDCALVQFEDSGVSQRVIQHGQHTLKVDGKEYMLTVSEHRQNLDPNKVITSLTATVDCSQIPNGRSTLTRLLGEHPSIETSCDSTKTLCRLRGAYTEVQSVLAQLLGSHPEDPQSLELSGSGRPFVSSSEFPIKTPRKKGDERDLTGGFPTPEEDLSLMVDADVFQYLQKHHGHEYQRLLSRYGVEVVDVTNQGITTLFLRVTTGDGDKERDRIELARTALSELYQESERRICQAELRKSDLDPRVDLQQAMETLRVRFPKLLLSDNDSCVFLIGDYTEVSEAKQFLLREHRVVETEDVASLLGIPSSRHTTAEERDTLAVSQSISSTLNVGKNRVRQSEDGKTYHVAARFKESGPPRQTPPGNLRGTSNPRKHSTHELRSEAAGDPSGVLRPLMRNKTSSDVAVKSTRSFRTPIQSPGKVHTGSMAKRTNSFAGTTQQRFQKTEDNSSAFPPRARTSSVSDQRQKDQPEVYHAEVVMSTMMWLHIKDVYSNQVETLTCDLQLKEGGSHGRIQSVIVISGSEQSAVTACQLALQELVDTISADICVHELHLSELGVSGVEDETLQACCAEVRRRFTKISVRVMRNSLYLTGPKRLCDQVAASLREVFSGDRTQADKQNDPTSASIGRQVNDGDACSSSETQPYSATQERISHLEGQAELANGADSQVARKDSILKEKLEKASMMDRRKTSVQGNKASPANVDGAWSVTPQNDKVTQSQQKEPQPGAICVCGEAGTSMNRTECGVVMCTKCLDAVHIHCRVCHSGPPQNPTPAGIQGTMNHCKLNFSLPGHNKHATIKVTYLVPDGIQKDHHPSPGKPFQGGVFEAFLPDCDKSRNLLPRLEDAFRQGLTFTVTSKEKGSSVTWDTIPHKTSLQGGRSGNGYPDSSYLERLSEVLTAHGIKGQSFTS
ncbi:uncharacterized protein LOC109519336 [Hippocampus comes]|uniref:E3 ubiquitin-protein ligase n=1 Tax=Hippocampus comes TaxID=109280 RepID=A0A3Q3DKF8_HIPCM|nr:PREDICTED: uncharacterized protein LOC109519336 [Hippocampus comes]XP_019731342.1 PREDICTED: uncharacterized protein LOC109519336 [Hippocampus comes]XP_019731343.1 PREDICTED: uncharacterized protein LOC109519336 [Hippocampus comes]XP_019731344.1 PREDICTED: uncharacterized protein LOC109519336 [Hippocampus comes]